MGAIDLIKEHPYAAGIGAVVLVGGFFILSGSGSSSSSGGTDYAAASQAAIQAGLELQAQQNQLAAQSMQIQGGVTVAQDTNATNLAIAKLAADVQTQQIESSAASANLANTLQAQLQTSLASMSKDVSLAQIASQQAIIANNNQTALGIQQSNNATLTSVTQIQATQAEKLAQTYTTGAIMQAKIAADAAQPKGLLSKIFG